MNNVSEEMKHLHKLAKQYPGKRFNHLWESLTDPRWLAQSWEQIRGNRGNQTSGIDQMTALDVDMPKIMQWAKELKTGKYRPAPVRRVKIPKPGGKTRPLGIPTIKDRVIQQGLKMLLEPIFEADFRICSHGFRQKRSTHTALRDVARAYPITSWVIEGDIKGCFDNIPHAGLMKCINKRIADGKILSLIRRFLKAGYMEDWQSYHTYSGTPQGGILSPLLANIYLHQLDEFIEDELGGNQIQPKKAENARRNPEYRKLEHRLTRLRRKLKEMDKETARNVIGEIQQLEKQRRKVAYYDKDKRHACKVKYVRYADDFVVLIAGNKQETAAIHDQVKEKLSVMGLTLSEEKTKLTHWSHWVHFLGYNIKGKSRMNGVTISPVLAIPREKYQQIVKAIGQIASYHNIPEADAIIQMGAMYRGWCNYYRYAKSPQKVFSRLGSKVWWQYAHYLARKHKSSIKKMVLRMKKAGNLKAVEKKGRRRLTFQTKVGNKTLILDLYPPRTGQIRAMANKQEWQVDLKPVIPLNWQSGRSLATRLAAIDRAKGICERCKTKSVAHVHHNVPMRNRSFLARVMSDKSQRYTAQALCKECHLEVHGGSFYRRRSSRNAGCAERRSPSVVSAS